MKKLRQLALALVAALAMWTASTPVAQATGGFIGEYYIIGIYVFGTGTGTNYAALTFDHPGSGFSSTCPNQNNVLYVDLSTTRGRAMLSIATAAMMAHTTVNAVGSNSCISSTITLPVFLQRSETVSWMIGNSM